jgi:hypothetical protein
VARAYRARKRFGRVYETVVLDSRRLLAGEKPELGIVCPGCGWRIYPVSYPHVSGPAMIGALERASKILRAGRQPRVTTMSC